ncbi:Dak1 domain-containing protein [Lipomyces tetrasporus]|uniref:Dak1 domain-containing protein n=1 Tax=Lipomyces tetrasporus TaxID=54092 RepID=A0AAD7QVY4_9ASCO|nr:Dak1 domain-containing protein [Lipomyces tetrasporus]KAJ8102348.1 Dak1 domain-containing protein [Lipomyces tetrasporus]
MATKHFFPEADGLVEQALLGTVASHADLGLLYKDKVIYHKSHQRNQVSVICGGGSGHEPAHAGYVGAGMLAAAICGDLFASPSAKQVQKGCMAVPSDQGHVLIVTNYTGDMLHFGLACEKLKAEGYKVGVVKAADDVSVGRKNGGMVGRRGLAGTIILNKLLGSMSATGASFEEVLALGAAAGSSLVTISAGLDHCHVPGRPAAYGELDCTTVEIGMGIHNEPGVRRLSPIPPIDRLIDELLRYMIDPTDSDRAYVPFDPADEVVLLVNNLGGMSTLEMRAVTQVAVAQVKKTYSITPSRVVAGTFMTSLNAPAFSLTLFNSTYASKRCGVPVFKILEYFDAETDALNWPKTHSYNEDATISMDIKPASEDSNSYATDILVDPDTLDRKLRKAAENIIASEPKLTEWDTEMGDGDCGTTIEAGVLALLQAMDEEGLARSGSVLKVVDAIVGITEDRMGGTLGAVFGIFFAALFNSLVAASSAAPKGTPVEKVIATATVEALASLRVHTPAKEGDRTVMDVMIPFVDAFKDGDIAEAAKVAKAAAEGTMKLRPKLGRATYVGGLQNRELLPPDPGAWGVHELIQGLAE